MENSSRKISLDMNSGYNNVLGWDMPSAYRPIRKKPMFVHPIVFVNGYGFYNATTNPDPVDTPEDIDTNQIAAMISSGSSGAASSSSAQNNCNFFQRLTGKCSTGETAKMKKCKAMYPNDYESYKKCLQEKGQGWTFLESLVGSLGFGNQAVAQNQAVSSYQSYGGNTPEKKGIGAAGWVAIVAVVAIGGFLAVRAMRKK